MKAFCKCQTRISRFTLGFLGLAFCVFMWGLQYKLSLYDPPGAATHKIPTAKLLSKDEQEIANEAVVTAKSSASEEEVAFALICLILPMLVAMNFFYRPLLVRREADFSQPWRLQLKASLSAFSFRPPPTPA